MEKIKLGDLCNPSQGQIKAQPDTIIDYIDISSVNNESKTVSGYQTMTFAESPSRARKVVKSGDILVSTVRPNLNAVAVLEEETPNITVASTGFCILDCKDTVDNRFVFNFCKSKAFIDEMVSQATGASYPAVTDKIVRAAMVPLYTYNEQKRIGKILDKLSGIIEKRKYEIEKLDNLIKARFVEMFGNPFDTKNTVEWPVKTIGELAESISDGSNVDKALYKKNGDVLFLRIQNIWCNEFRLDDSVFISEEENESYKDTSLKRGDLLITKIGRYYTTDSSLGRVSVYLGENNKANYSNNIMRVRFRKGINSEYVNALMNLDDYNKFIRRSSVGGTDKRALSKALIARYPVVVPSLDKQDELVDFIHQVDKSKIAVQTALDKTQLLYDSLMQHYFG